MSVVSKIFILLIALEHFYFLYVEMFRWTTPKARKAFGTTEEFALASKTLAANQGLYNGFLACGLVWALLAPVEMARPLTYFFAGCVLVAGLYGGATVTKRVYLIQGLPAALTLISAFLLG